MSYRFRRLLTFFEVQRAVVVSDLVGRGFKQCLDFPEQRLGGHVGQAHVAGTGGTEVQRLRRGRDASVRAAVSTDVRVVAKV